MTNTKVAKEPLGFKDDPDFFKKAGRRGGVATLNIHGIEHFKTISKKAIEKRWPNRHEK